MQPRALPTIPPTIVPTFEPLPIDAMLPAIVDALRAGPTLVLEAPPGAGKTTRVPRALLEAGFGEGGEIVVLEPRRLAARLAARRTAQELGEGVGGAVGYQVRFEDVTSARTRVRFVTEGVLTRRLLASSDLAGVSTVIVDEVHERHLQGDVALALVERLRRTRRPRLRVVAMSATLPSAPLAAYLGAPVLRSEGQRFDVSIDYLRAPDDRPLALQVASAVRSLVAGGLDGDVLVFLPGAGEIRRARDACAKVAAEHDLLLVALHGELSPAEQDEAVRPAGRRKVILSTNVAESSVTVPGVSAVVDSGLARVASQAPWSGLPRLRVEKISRASATQRAGRAGRTRAGRCLRLYTRADFDARPEHEAPEIRRLDLAQTRLELTALVARDLAWLEPPPQASIAAADDLLARLGAIDAAGELTPTGRRMLDFAVHPRVARVIVEGERRGIAEDACVAAAVLSEGDFRQSARATFGAVAPNNDAPTERSDVAARLEDFREARESGFSSGAVRAMNVDAGTLRAVARAADRFRDACRRPGPNRRARDAAEPVNDAATADALGIALLAGYPDRVARRVRPGGRQIALASGGQAELSAASVVRDATWVVALDAEERAAAGGPHARAAGVVVRLASAIEPEWVIDLFPDEVEERRDVRFNAQSERVEARDVLAWRGAVLHEGGPVEPTDAEAAPVLAEAALSAGPAAFAPENALERWLPRARFAARAAGKPDALDDAAVRATLAALCEGCRSFADLRSAGLVDALRARLGGAVDVDRVAPERLRLAGGRSVAIQYSADKAPSVASRLQDFFGTSEGPRLGGVPLVIELLAPNGRAVQVTTDLAGFWSRHYPALRKELMRRYPKHSWPEDPTTARPPAPRTTRTTR